MSRRSERESIITILYNVELINCDIEDTIENLYDGEIPSEYIYKTARNIIKDQNKIDEVISSNLENWGLNRLSFLDRAILRLATYEMMSTDTPVEIAINEAIELTKKYTDLGDGKSKAFNNKVLDSIAKKING